MSLMPFLLLFGCLSFCHMVDAWSIDKYPGLEDPGL